MILDQSNGGADPLVGVPSGPGRPRPAAGTTMSTSSRARAGRRGRRPRTRGSAPPIPPNSQLWRKLCGIGLIVAQARTNSFGQFLDVIGFFERRHGENVAIVLFQIDLQLFGEFRQVGGILDVLLGLGLEA